MERLTPLGLKMSLFADGTLVINGFSNEIFDKIKRVMIDNTEDYEILSARIFYEDSLIYEGTTRTNKLKDYYFQKAMEYVEEVNNYAKEN